MSSTTAAPALSLARAMAEAAAEIDQALDVLLPPEEGDEAPLFAAMRYAARALAQEEDGTLHAHGPAAPPEGLPLPAGATLDAEGFLRSARLHGS